MLSFIRGIETFESPLFFGTPASIKVITTEIYNSINQRATPDYQYATAMSFVDHGADVPAGALAMAAAARPQLSDRDRQGLFAGVDEARPVALGDVRASASCSSSSPWCCRSASSLIGSFFQFFGFYSWDMLTLDHYRAVFGNSEFWRALPQHHAARP